MHHRRFRSFLWLAAGAAAATYGVASCAAGDANELGSSGPPATAGASVTATSTTSTATEGAGASSSSSSSKASAGGAGGAGGMGGAAGSGGVGGAGGQATTSSSGGSAPSSVTSSSASQSASSSSSGAGGAMGGTVLMLAGSSSSIFAASYQTGTGWLAQALPDATDHPPAVAFSDATHAISVIRSTNASGELRWAQWALGTFGGFTTVKPGVTSRDTVSITNNQGAMDIVYLGDNFDHYWGREEAGAWSPADGSVGSNPQAFGPSAGAVAAKNGSDTIVYAGNDGDLYDQVNTGGSWSTGVAHGVAGTVTLTPSIVAPAAGGPDLLVVFVEAGQVAWMAQTAGTWSPPVLLASGNGAAATNNTVSLAALPNGQAIAAWRSTAGGIYMSRFTNGGPPTWSTPAPLATPNYTTNVSPAVAAGVGSADAELVFVDATTSEAFHTRLTGTTWSSAVMIGGSNLTSIALASTQ